MRPTMSRGSANWVFSRQSAAVMTAPCRCSQAWLVARILPDGSRKRASLFSGFLSHSLIRDRYGRPGKGNDKGGYVPYVHVRVGDADGYDSYVAGNLAQALPEAKSAGPT